VTRDEGLPLPREPAVRGMALVSMDPDELGRLAARWVADLSAEPTG
jgi:hypothetical protein